MDIHGISWNEENTDIIKIEKIPSIPLIRSHDLFEFIEMHNHLDEQTAKIIFKQIVSVIFHLNSIGIVHSDIKDENILIDEYYNVKIIDFGSSFKIGQRINFRG